MKKPIKLKLQKTVKVKPIKPFAFDPTFHKPDHFTAGDNYWKPGVCWQTWNWRNKPLGIKFLNKGMVDKPLVEIKIYAKGKLADDFVDSLVEEIKYLYNFNLDLSDFYNTFKKDKFLNPILKKWRGMRPGHPSSLYEYLVIGIVLQNASVRRSIQMFRVLLEKYGKLLEFDGKKLWCFWSPGKLQKVSEDDLRALKVGYRAKSIKKIDDYFLQGLVDEKELRRKDRETQMAELLKLYGVGPATVWYLLFDVFHHWDFLTIFRLGNRKFIQNCFSTEILKILYQSKNY